MEEAEVSREEEEEEKKKKEEEEEVAVIAGEEEVHLDPLEREIVDSAREEGMRKKRGGRRSANLS